MGPRRLGEEPAAEVIPLPGANWKPSANALEAALDESPVRTDRSLRDCWHERSAVNEGARTVTCRDCGVALDPIEVLQKVAVQRERLVHAVHELRKDRKRLEAAVDELLREERNAKSRIRTARRRALEVDRDAIVAALRQATEPLRRVMGYRPYDDLDDQAQRRYLDYAIAVVEAYAGALEAETPIPRGGAPEGGSAPQDAA